MTSDGDPMRGDDVWLERFEALDIGRLEVADAPIDRDTDAAPAAALHRQVQIEQHVRLAAAIADHAQKPEPIDKAVAVGSTRFLSIAPEHRRG